MIEFVHDLDEAAKAVNDWLEDGAINGYRARVEKARRGDLLRLSDDGVWQPTKEAPRLGVRAVYATAVEDSQGGWGVVLPYWPG